MNKLVTAIAIAACMMSGAALLQSQPGQISAFNFVLSDGPCNMSSGTGAPSGGADCDLYLRDDAPDVNQVLYVRDGGIWAPNSTGGGGVSGGGRITYIQKASLENVTSSVTLQDDDDFSFAAKANTDYDIEVFAIVDGPTAADFDWAWTVPASSTGWHTGHRLSTTATTATDSIGTSAVSTFTSERNAGLAGDGTFVLIRILAHVQVAGTAGNITLQWAQGTSDATATTMNADSWMRYSEIATTTWTTEVIVKAADETVTSSTTLQNDDHFTFECLANTDYIVEINAFVDGAAAASLKWNWTVPTGGTGWSGGPRALTQVSNDFDDTATEDFGGDEVGSINDAGFVSMQITSIIRCAGTAGTVTWQWAQNASNATGTTVHSKSWMQITADG